MQQAAVHGIQAALVHFEHRQRGISGLAGHVPVAAHFGVVAHTPQQPVGDSRRAPGARRHFPRAGIVHGDAELAGGDGDDFRQFVDAVEVQPQDDAESVPQRRGEQAGAGRRPHQREALELQLDGARRRPFADDDVELAVFHRRIEDLLHHRRQAMDLVDEQHVAVVEIGQLRGQVALPFQHRPRGAFQGDRHLIGDDVRQRGLAETGRPEDQRVVEGVAAAPRRFDEDRHLLLRRLLADERVEPRWPQRPVEGRVVVPNALLRGVEGSPRSHAVRMHGHAATILCSASFTSASTSAPSPSACATSPTTRTALLSR